MTEKVNRIRQEQAAPERKVLPEEPERKPNVRQRAESVFSFFSNERFRKIMGLLLLLASVYLFVAFTSYLLTWRSDQSVVGNPDAGWHILFDAENNKVENWLGIVGAIIAHQFIEGTFGIASYAFVFLLFLLGYRVLFKVQLLPAAKSIAWAIFSLVFFSVFFGFVFSFFESGWFFIAGSVGVQVNEYLNNILGKFGTACLLLFSGLTGSVIAFNIDFHPPKFFEKKPEVITDPVAVAEDEGPVNHIITDAIDEPVAEEEEALPEELEPVLVPSVAEVPVEELLMEEASPEVVIPEIPVTEPFSFDLNAPLVETAAVAAVVSAGPELEIETVEPPEEESIADVGLQEEENSAAQLVKQFGEYDPTLDLSGYKFPIPELLENHGSGKVEINKQELEDNKNRIVETLGHYDIGIEKIMATIGPTVTLYEIVPKAGVRISKIKNLEDDIALSLAALGIRIIAPIPGRGTIGIEVPNQNPEIVSMRSLLASEKFQSSKHDLPLALGKTISNELYIADLAKMPHLLMAGATGQGKSVGINAILVSLLYKKHPSQLKFVLVDPKKVELTLFKKIERHFLAKLPNEGEAIITDTKKVIYTLNSLCIEMDQRYDLLKDASVRNLKEYNQKFIQRRLNPNEGHRYLPYIVLVVDEFADLMMTAGKEVETPIARLAQLARAVGIHLIIATQRPSVNIITGTIKANFPARIAFRVTSKIDSRTILDSGGADQLIGRGDMLLSTGNDLIRLQCPFVDTPEVEKITEYIGGQRGYPSAHMLPEFVGEDGEAGAKEFNADEKDQFFEEAARLVVRHQQGSTSLIQRKMKLGYNRAGRIMDQLEAAGIVGPFEGSKAREVLYSDEGSLEHYLNMLSEKK